MCEILVLGYFGFGNAGDDALGVATVQELKNCNKQYDITATVGKENVFSEYEVNTCELSPTKSLKKVYLAEAVIATGGTHLHNYGNLKLPRAKVLLYYFLISLIGKISRTELHLLGHGFGPVNDPFSRFTIRVILTWADTVIVRDSDSYQLADNYTKSWLTFDLAALLLPMANMENNDQTLGISLTPGFKRYYDQPGRDDKLVENLAFILNQNDDRWDGIKVFVMNTEPSGGDIQISRKLIDLLERSNAELILYEHDPNSFIQAIGTVDSLIGMRFHSLVFAYLNSIPAAAISYHPKCNQFQSYVGVASSMTTDIENTAIHRLETLLNELDSKNGQFNVSIHPEQASELALKSFNILERESDKL